MRWRNATSAGSLSWALLSIRPRPTGDRFAAAVAVSRAGACFAADFTVLSIEAKPSVILRSVFNSMSARATSTALATWRATWRATSRCICR